MRSDHTSRFSVTARITIVPVLVVWSAVSVQGVHGQGTADDYDRWRTFSERTSGKIFRDRVSPNWVGPDAFWYRLRTGIQKFEYVVVDAVTGQRTGGLDRDGLKKRLAEQHPDRDDLQNVIGVRPQTVIVRSRATGDATTIEFDNQTKVDLKVFYRSGDGNERYYGDVAAGTRREWSTYVGHAWLLRDADDKPRACFVATDFSGHAVIDDATPIPKSPPDRRGSGRGSSQSPGGRWSVEFSDHNVVVRDVTSNKIAWKTDEGAENNFYGGRVHWSPDAKHFVVMRTVPGTRRKVHLIESSPKDSHHGNLITMDYAKPGDRLDAETPVLFSADGGKRIVVKNTLFPNAFALTDLQWNDDSSGFSFLYNQRSHQLLRLIGVDAKDGRAKSLISEVSDTFVHYSDKTYLKRLDETGEAIWMSERSGWNHLYLVDLATGELRDITRDCLGDDGHWVVRGVEKIDVKSRTLWVKVSGVDPAEDPYHVHLLKVGFDGKDARMLTAGDGDHRWEISEDGRYLIDRYSRVDLPWRNTLRDASTGEAILELEKADVRPLLSTGWRTPERFVAPGRDGETDIHGIIVRPTNFDPRKTYPVLEYIYAGPHGSFVPKTFQTHARLYQMAELGFIVVQIDGMGTNHRGKAFHDVCWKNLGDSGFADRIAWMKAAAETRPEMDLDRVGIWGGSAGGQSALRALLTHGDFYRAASADCGCHDNRVDKIWWNEQWMGWPIGPHYKDQSNVTQASRLQGDLMLIVGELDRNVDPISTMQVVDALVKADKDFELLVMPGVGHGAAGHPYAKRRQADFFVRKLHGVEPRSP